MIKAKHIRLIIGILGVLVIFIPLSGFTIFWKNIIEIILGALIILVVIHRFVIVESFHIYQAFQEERSKRQALKTTEEGKKEKEDEHA